ncbi:RnfABCDGE type electron transport complex subunit G [Fusobacterium sp.]|uniref:RnfABCDGE type electron transport complex subunit G n=1 Tax=Fusobacterium sp. TaxID=68766 RepID=UPI002637FDA6|nr:RnfABCDGE type electron transport complex subunit G [Fusobacterium sp.]
MERNRFIHYGSVLLAIAAVCAGLLAGVNGMTKGTITNNKIEATKAARVAVVPEAKSFDEKATITVDGLEFIPGLDENGNPVGYVVVVSQGGYAANIDFSLGIGLDGKVTGLSVMNHQETPGLGAKISGEEWQKHWIGTDKSYEFTKAADAFAGATVSPTAVYTGIQRALSAFENGVRK